MQMYDIIEKKRDGEELKKEEIAFFIKGYTEGAIPDYQASAFLMACYLNGMTDEETVILTEEMKNSGETADLSSLKNLSADKHSTGGVGDKTTLIVAPLAAAMGLKIAKMSGRGLGHTGGTVDKLESINGYKTNLSVDEFLSQTEKIGISVVGQTGNFAPADKKIYALRDVTATVSSIPLIASSIMSKKLAAGSKTIVLDVKYGSGAFMKSAEEAEKLAQKMVDIGVSCGRNTAALITNMDIPLGTHIGNRLEVKEAVEVLKGDGDEALKEVSLNLAALMRSEAFGEDFETSLKIAEETLESGMAFEKFKEWIAFQGGDVSFLEDIEGFAKAEKYQSFCASVSGYISKIDAELIGKAACLLGAGREKMGDKIDFSAGIVFKKSFGDYLSEGEEIAILQTSEKEFQGALELIKKAILISDEKPKKSAMIKKTIKGK